MAIVMPFAACDYVAAALWKKIAELSVGRGDERHGGSPWDSGGHHYDAAKCKEFRWTRQPSVDNAHGARHAAIRAPRSEMGVR